MFFCLSNHHQINGFGSSDLKEGEKKKYIQGVPKKAVVQSDFFLFAACNISALPQWCRYDATLMIGYKKEMWISDKIAV